MTAQRILASLAITFALLIQAQSVWAQGRTDYFNVESPQVHPIEIATIGGEDYLLIVNTPDNTLEIWQTDEAVAVENRFVMRIPVGLEPVSVRWNADLTSAYVANFLGDSISVISLTPDSANLVSARLLTQAQVTDAPLDMTFAKLEVDGEARDVLITTHMTLDAISKLDARTLLPITAGSERLDALVETSQNLDFDLENTPDDLALKEPRTAQVACERLFVIGHKGGNTERYDFDLYTESLRTGNTSALGGLGSQNTNMALAPNDQLLVVGAMARNDLRDEDQVAAAETGFVKSMLYLVENPCSDAPVVHGRDVNLFSLAEPIDQVPLGARGGQLGNPFPEPTPIFQPVPKSKALAYLTDVIAYAPNGTLEKVFFTAFSSDRVGIIEPSTSLAPIHWPLRRVNVTAMSASVAGPRGLALRGGPDPRLYVLNRIDNSVTIIDVDTEMVLESFALDADPTPAYITEGRRFLYDAKLSGNGFVSCASCHHDGRTDGLAWDLGDGSATPVPPELQHPVATSVDNFDADKEFMVTQSLEGLLNFEVDQDFQQLFTNAPYHWRGDKEDFLAFNGAFATLLGGSLLDPDDMEKFEEFINSIHYAPNPKQSLDRIPPGALGDPDDNDLSVDVSGEGAMLGLKLFHIADSGDGTTCVGCHALPEGSDNVLTENIAAVNPHPVLVPPLAQAGDKLMETSALRLLFQKEARLDRDGSSQLEKSPITGYEGMMHTGVDIPLVSDNFNGVASLNGFNTNFFSATLCDDPDVQYCKNVEALMEFVHQFDTGVGPMVGRTITVTEQNRSDPNLLLQIDELELQATLANTGISAQVWVDGTIRGIWYDLSASPPVYREEPTGLTLDRAAVLSLIDGPRDRLVLSAVPLGSERRTADPSGMPLPLFGPPPTSLALLPMVTNTWYAEVPSLSALGALSFIGTHALSVAIYQLALTLPDPDGTPAAGFGLCQFRHEAPRRFRVSGEHIRHGAQLHLFVQNDPNAGVPNVAIGPEDPGQVQMLRLALPLHATGERDGDGFVIWETAAEMEPLLFYRLMAGRPDQSGSGQGVMVGLTDIDFDFQIDPLEIPALFDPVSWNQHYVRLVNADGSSTDAGWQALEIEPGPLCP